MGNQLPFSNPLSSTQQMAESAKKSKLSSPAEVPSANGECFINAIPRELLQEIFFRLGACQADFASAALVCKSWSNLVADASFWLDYCLKEGVLLPPKELRSEHQFDYRKIFSKRPYGRNLIKNPSGANTIPRIAATVKQKELLDGLERIEDTTEGDSDVTAHLLRDWKLLRSGGDGWRVELPPKGADHTFPCCFATSFHDCMKRQIVDLIAEGVDPWVLNNSRAKITVSEWYAGRFDCGSRYEFKASLLKVLPTNPHEGVDAEEPEHTCTKDDLWGEKSKEQQKDDDDSDEETSDDEAVENDDDGSIAMSYEVSHLTAQWAGKEWNKEEKIFSGYPAGVVAVCLTSGGQDTQFWAGYYGPKMANASVTVSF